ncbi:nuclear transport factor 2 family protein [Aquimarina algicola]|uniref:Nuclear transport factor 2 family protein n=1 Tax=Aquimarina algicola TaxID=2589995 RepID=A0A504IZA2_9FLAO|nr:nuclear transport factor 2 family protein [Aquimarina algicola]TPN81675.1 nuclear transport factor 2 family protein [Aquimarina algicola]
MKQESLVIETARKYPMAFKQMDTKLIDIFFSKKISKIGYEYDYIKKSWMGMTNMNCDDLKTSVASYNQNNIMPDTEPDITILDLQDKIAIVKVEIEWAPKIFRFDYLLLTKEDKNWCIEKILWQSIP